MRSYPSFLLSILIAGNLVAVDPAGRSNAPLPKLLSTTDVFAYSRSDPYDRENLYGFNHAPSVTVLPDGRLLAAWFSGPFEASIHQLLLGAYSADGGRTWSEAQVLQDDPRRSDFDPAFIAEQNRTWMFFTVGRWDRYPFVGLSNVEAREVGPDSFKLLARVTKDAGKTWSDPAPLMKESAWGSRSNGLKLATGELLLPIYHFHRPYTSSVLISKDDGETWQRYGSVRPESGIAAEPTVSQLSSGKLVMALRTNDGWLWTAHSQDRGQTWSAPQRCDIEAAESSHNLFCTSKGVLVLAINACKPPRRTPLTLRASADEGRTWGQPLKLDAVDDPAEGEEIWGRQVAYPSIAELSDGTLIVVWAKLEMSNSRQSGVIRCARVRIK
jgi:predicted neuraminidase